MKTSLMADEYTIDGLLKQRNARLHGGPCDSDAAEARATLTKAIEENYPLFEPVRDSLLRRRHAETRDLHDAHDELLGHLDAHDMIAKKDGRFVAAHVEAKRYLSGGWLEELGYLAAIEAGAEEAVFAQRLLWQVGEYTGENEIDLIVRRDDRLGFMSCKALQSEYNSDTRKHRNKLMEALHEADNLADHFGLPGERVAVLVTTDLIDEVRDMPRYMALMGKASRA